MIFLTSGCGKNENELVLVTEAGFAPYEYYEDGKIVGVDIDIAYEIAKGLGFNKVIAGIREENVASQKLHEKLGFLFVEDFTSKNGKKMKRYFKNL